MVMLCDIVCMTFGFAYSWLRCSFMETLQEHFLLREKVKPDLFSVVWDVIFFHPVLFCSDSVLCAFEKIDHPAYLPVYLVS